MPRLSVELTAEQHQLIKVSAAMQGKSIKEFILERALADLRPPVLSDTPVAEPEMVEAPKVVPIEPETVELPDPPELSAEPSTHEAEADISLPQPLSDERLPPDDEESEFAEEDYETLRNQALKGPTKSLAEILEELAKKKKSPE